MITQRNFAQRIKRLQKQLKPNQIFLLSSPSQVTYFTGFTFLVHQEREAYFICTKESANIIYTSFSPVHNFEFINYYPGTYSDQFKIHLETILKQVGLVELPAVVFYDAESLFVSEFNVLQELKDVHTNLSLEPLKKYAVSDLLMKKDRQEIALIKQASEITKKLMRETIAELRAGISEQEVETLIADKLKSQGAELAFPTIVAFGEHAAAPHHQPSDTILEENTPVLIDMGAKYQSYCSDMTRTVWFGSSPSKQFMAIETVVKNAYSAALSMLTQRGSAQITSKQVDAAARTLISNAGYGDAFIHTTGHGLGLEIHEQPSLNWSSKTVLEPQVVVTIEPGIYLEGQMGYRHENTILVTQEGAEELTT